MDHNAQQLNYFANFKRTRRWEWQQDPFVAALEQEALAPVVAEIKSRAVRQTPVRVLETGCGDGMNAWHLAQAGCGAPQVEWKGVDLTPQAVEEAKRRGYDVQVGDGCALPFADAQFDIVYCRDVLHHVEDDQARQAFYAEMKRVTVPGGALIAVEPNPCNPSIFGLALMVPAERGLFSITEGRIKKLFPGAEVIRACPSSAWRMWYHNLSPIYQSSFSPLARRLLQAWEKFCRIVGVTYLWSYRIYSWKKS